MLDIKLIYTLFTLFRLSEKPRGFGFVTFESEDDAAQAIDNMNDAELFGMFRVLLCAGKFCICYCYSFICNCDIFDI